MSVYMPGDVSLVRRRERCTQDGYVFFCASKCPVAHRCILMSFMTILGAVLNAFFVLA